MQLRKNSKYKCHGLKTLTTPPTTISEWQSMDIAQSHYKIDLLAFYDRFHQKKQKRPEESLWSLNLCPDLRSKINSSVAGQLNRELAAIRYSLPQMNEVHFKHTTRILLELHNRNINGKFLEDMTRQSSIPLTVGRMGTLVCMSSGWFTFFRDKSVLNTWMCNVRS